MATAPSKSSSTKAHFKALAQELCCPICYELFQIPSITPCSHTFCQECILGAIRLKQECPVCKNPVWKRALKPNLQMENIVRHFQHLEDLRFVSQTQGVRAVSCTQQSVQDTSHLLNKENVAPTAGATVEDPRPLRTRESARVNGVAEVRKWEQRVEEDVKHVSLLSDAELGVRFKTLEISMGHELAAAVADYQNVKLELDTAIRRCNKDAELPKPVLQTPLVQTARVLEKKDSGSSKKAKPKEPCKRPPSPLSKELAPADAVTPKKRKTDKDRQAPDVSTEESETVSIRSSRSGANSNGEKTILVSPSVSESKVKLMRSLCGPLRGKLASSFSSDVSLIISKCNSRFEAVESQAVLLGLLHGIPIIRDEYILYCNAESMWVSVDPFIASTEALQNSLNSKIAEEDTLFRGKNFFLYGLFGGNSHQMLMSLIPQLGGVIQGDMQQEDDIMILCDPTCEGRRSLKTYSRDASKPMISYMFVLQCLLERKLVASRNFEI
eukprot:ANDGO_00768.mRNA.1 Protein BREAST CANCER SUSCEPTIBILITY 1 homolog